MMATIELVVDEVRASISSKQLTQLVRQPAHDLKKQVPHVRLKFV